MAKSFVTDVQLNGLFKNYLISYDRAGTLKDNVYLETSALSWVEEIFRRNVYDRFSYYDEIFPGTGDTEFESRIIT